MLSEDNYEFQSLELTVVTITVYNKYNNNMIMNGETMGDIYIRPILIRAIKKVLVCYSGNNLAMRICT